MQKWNLMYLYCEIFLTTCRVECFNDLNNLVLCYSGISHSIFSNIVGYLWMSNRPRNPLKTSSRVMLKF